MEELAKLEAERGTAGYAAADGSAANGVVETAGGKKRKRERVASNEMCTFLYGSVNPAGIIAPAIVATFISTLTAVVYCKIKNRKQK